MALSQSLFRRFSLFFSIVTIAAISSLLAADAFALEEGNGCYSNYEQCNALIEDVIGGGSGVIVGGYCYPAIAGDAPWCACWIQHGYTGGWVPANPYQTTCGQP